MTTVKITELANIGANLATSTVVPVVNMVGTPTTQKTTVGGIANLILEGAGVDYPEATVALLAQTVSNAAQPNITSVGTLTNVVVSGNATVNGNITSNGTAYVGNLSTTGIATITTLAVGTTANLGAVGNVTITGGTAGQVLSTNGNGVLSWASDATSYGNSNVANYLPTFTGNIGANVVTANLFSGNGTNLTNIAGANVSGFVPNANVANTAFAVAGANVSGFVPNANVANTAFAVAGANVSGFVPNANVANTAFAVAGANVSGFVPNANVANTAFAVAAANVSGLGNIATINLTGSNSNVLYGNGVFAAVAGGANTGNVTFSDQVVMGTGGNDGTGGLYLAPGNASIANSAVQYLRVRGGDVVTHIHLDTGNNAFYDQYFGDDGKYVKLANTGNIVINSNDDAGNTAQWTFGTNGNLNLPGNLVIAGNTSVFGTNATLIQTTDNRPLLALSSGANGAVSSLWVEDIGNVGTSNIAAVYANPTVGSGIVRIAVGQNGGGGPNLWDFGATGNLTLPANTFAINYANGTQVSLGGNVSNISNGNSNVNIATANGNVTIAAVGNTTMTVTGTGANITGTLNVTGNITGNTNGFAIGYLNIPQVAAANATLALTDAGKHYYSTTAGNLTLTVPLNSSVAFATGTAVSIVVQAAGNILVNAASGVTLYMAGNSTAANRVVGGYGMATLMKVGTDTWFINGTGVA